MQKSNLTPFWDEIDRCISLVDRYHDFEIIRSHQQACVWEGQSETCIYGMTHTRIQITAHIDGLLHSHFVIINCIPARPLPGKGQLGRAQFLLKGSIDGHKFAFSNEPVPVQLVLMLKTLLFEEAVVKMCISRNLSASMSPTHDRDQSTALVGETLSSTIYKQDSRFSSKLRFDYTVHEAEELLVSVHFFESYLFSATADPPADTQPVHFSNTSDFIRFLEYELDNPRFDFFGAIGSWFTA